MSVTGLDPRRSGGGVVQALRAALRVQRRGQHKSKNKRQSYPKHNVQRP